MMLPSASGSRARCKSLEGEFEDAKQLPELARVGVCCLFFVFFGVLAPFVLKDPQQTNKHVFDHERNLKNPYP